MVVYLVVALNRYDTSILKITSTKWVLLRPATILIQLFTLLRSGQVVQ